MYFKGLKAQSKTRKTIRNQGSEGKLKSGILGHVY